jgi:hypothetical protein
VEIPAVEPDHDRVAAVYVLDSDPDPAPDEGVDPDDPVAGADQDVAGAEVLRCSSPGPPGVVLGLVGGGVADAADDDRPGGDQVLQFGSFLCGEVGLGHGSI